MKLLFSIFLIPLVISIGLTSSFALQPEDIETECREGQALVFRTNSMDYICTSQSAAALWSRLGMAEIVYFSDTSQSESPTEIEITESDNSEPITSSIPKTIETRMGILTLESDYPTTETQRTLEDEVFYQRAVQVYLLSLPAVAGAGIFDEFDEAGALSGDIIFWSDFMTSDTVVATANRSVLYTLSFLDLSVGPMVIEVPPGLYGAVNNLYQQPVTDIGATGPDMGDGGKFLILPPNFEGEVPDGYFVAQSDTMQNFYLARGSTPNGDTSVGIEQIKGAKIYKLSESENPPTQKFVDMWGKPFDMMHPTTDGFWEFLHKVYSEETVVRSEDKILIGLMHTIGVVPGESFPLMIIQKNSLMKLQ